MSFMTMDIGPLERRSSYNPSATKIQADDRHGGSKQKLIDYLRSEVTRLLILDCHSRSVSASYGPSSLFRGGTLTGQDMPTLLVRAKQNVLMDMEQKLRYGDAMVYGADDAIRKMREELSMAFVELDSRWRKWSEEATRPMSFV